MISILDKAEVRKQRIIFILEELMLAVPEDTQKISSELCSVKAMELFQFIEIKESNALFTPELLWSY
jgi:hypothetical protein